MKKYILLMLLWLPATTGFAKISVVTSSSDLAAIAKEITGDLAKVDAIASGKSNLHYVEVLPSYMLKVAKADIYCKVGLGLDYWANSIIDGSRNGDLIVVDCSQGIEPLERPTQKVDASMGDIHPEGNPHYWLDPRNGKVIAENIFDALTKADPENTRIYRANLEAFDKKLDEKWAEWQQRISKLDGLEIVSYHNTWPYLATAFGFNVVGFIEPKPGIEPTASHTAQLIDMMQGRQIKAVFKEPYFSPRAAETIAKATGAIIFVAPPSVGGVEGADTYFSLFDTLLGMLEAATGLI